MIIMLFHIRYSWSFGYNTKPYNLASQHLRLAEQLYNNFIRDMSKADEALVIGVSTVQVAKKWTRLVISRPLLPIRPLRPTRDSTPCIP